MSRKVCFTDEDGQVGICIKEDEDCATCTCIPEERRKEFENDICGFSMGGAILRKCIKGRCRFWVDTTKERDEFIRTAREMGCTEAEIQADIGDAEEGYCVFEVM